MTPDTCSDPVAYARDCGGRTEIHRDYSLARGFASIEGQAKFRNWATAQGYQVEPCERGLRFWMAQRSMNHAG